MKKKNHKNKIVLDLISIKQMILSNLDHFTCSSIEINFKFSIFKLFASILKFYHWLINYQYDYANGHRKQLNLDQQQPILN